MARHELKKLWPFRNAKCEIDNDFFIVLIYETAKSKRCHPQDMFKVHTHINGKTFDCRADRRRSFSDIDEAVKFFNREVEFWRGDK